MAAEAAYLSGSGELEAEMVGGAGEGGWSKGGQRRRWVEVDGTGSGGGRSQLMAAAKLGGAVAGVDGGGEAGRGRGRVDGGGEAGMGSGRG